METQAKYKKIITELAAAFAPFDAKVLEGSKLWAAERVAALSAFRASDEYKALRGNSFAKYEKLFAIAGGKTWFNVLDGRDNAGIEAYVTRNCASVAAKRTVSIANKLEKAGVTSVINSDFQYSHDGFNGTFVVETDAGRKVVTVNTVVAGGYNVQCLHLRVLVKVKPAQATSKAEFVSKKEDVSMEKQEAEIKFFPETRNNKAIQEGGRVVGFVSDCRGSDGAVYRALDNNDGTYTACPDSFNESATGYPSIIKMWAENTARYCALFDSIEGVSASNKENFLLTGEMSGAQAAFNQGYGSDSVNGVEFSYLKCFTENDDYKGRYFGVYITHSKLNADGYCIATVSYGFRREFDRAPLGEPLRREMFNSYEEAQAWLYEMADVIAGQATSDLNIIE